MNELKPEAVGADYRGSTRPVSNREAEETRARLIELGQTLRIERIFQQPVETVACVLGYASLQDRIRLDRCANPETCSICSDGKTHTPMKIPFSNN